MNEFIEKLIGEIHKLNDDDYSESGCQYRRGINSCIGVINELAEEYKGGWIPCSERLPEYDGGYICTVKECQESLELIYSTHDNSWMDEFDSEYEVIAWQPKPEIYIEKQ